MTFRFSKRPERTEGADNRTRDEQIACWRNWNTYLTAKQALLDIRRSESSPRQTDDVEQTADTPAVRRAAAEKKLKTLPSDMRTRFDQHVAARQQRVRHELEQAQRDAGRHHVTADADVVEATALTQLVDEAQGRVENEKGQLGWGLFPWTDNKFYQVEIAKISATPDDASYDASSETAAASARTRSLRLIPVVLIGGFLLMYLMWPKSSASAASTSAQLTVGDAPIQAWRVTTAVGIDTSGTVTTYPLTEHSGTTWPRLRGDAPAGRWHTNAAYPLELCLPDAALATLTTLRVQGSGDTPERSYEVASDAPARPDLRIASCGAAAGTWSRYGMLTDTVPLATHQLDEAVTLPGDVQLTVTDVAVRGPAQDPATPANRAEIRLTVTTSRSLDWSGITTLLTPQSGDEVGPKVPRQVGATHGAQLSDPGVHHAHRGGLDDHGAGRTNQPALAAPAHATGDACRARAAGSDGIRRDSPARCRE